MPPSEAGLAELSEILVFDRSLDGTAQHVADLARTSLARCDGAGMHLVDRNGLSTRVFTDARSSVFDALQEELDDGPCVETLRSGESRDYEPVTSDDRWPSFGPAARQAGLIACLALPLIAEGRCIGVLNLYAWANGGFAGWNRQHCTTFAARASVSLASVQAFARTQLLIAELQARVALPDDLVDQAHGVLIEIESTSLEDATERLAEMAEARGCTLDIAAQSVLDSVNRGP